MVNTRILVCALAALACGQALAQDTSDQQSPARSRAIVYKCTGADGAIIYSQAPCSTDPKKVQEIDTSSALIKGSGGAQGEIATSVADGDCRTRARQSAYGNLPTSLQSSNDHIADYQQRQAKLAQQKVYAPNGSGDLIDDPNSGQAIADLNVSIEQEREFQRKANANAATAFQSAAKACDDAAAAAEAAKKNAQPQQKAGQQ